MKLRAVDTHTIVSLTMINGDKKPRAHKLFLCKNEAEASAIEKQAGEMFPKGTTFAHPKTPVVKFIDKKLPGDIIDDAPLPCGKTRICIRSVADLPKKLRAGVDRVVHPA